MKLQAVLGDITLEETDGIVNAANSTLLGGGGVDGAIHQAAGPDLKKTCETLGGCRTGEARLTRGFNLKAKWIIHTVGPIWSGGQQNEPELLRSCYLNCLKIAERLELQSLSFPSVSTGVYQYPVEAASEIAVQTVCSFKSQSIEQIRFICFDSTTYHHYQRGLERVEK